MNVELVRYGILEEESDVRFHIGFKSVIVFRTGMVKKMLEDNGGYDGADRRWKLKYATQKVNGKSVRTGEGWPIKPSEIEGYVSIPIPEEIMNISPKDDERAKGRKAVIIVRKMIERNLIPSSFLLEVTEVNECNLQIKGIDLKGKPLTCQVKCDLPYDHFKETKNGAWWGTGNLFIQRRECNPERKY